MMELMKCYVKIASELEDFTDSETEKDPKESYNYYLNIFPLQNVCNESVSLIAAGIDSENNSIRSKSIKFATEMLADPKIDSLLQFNIVQKLIILLGDKSPVVRDSAVDVFGKYLNTLKGTSLTETYQVLGQRIHV